MPAFKYTSKARVPGAISGARAQARSVSAPQLNAPQQSAVLQGNTVQQRQQVEQPNLAAATLAQGVTELGEMFYNRSMQLADQQSDLEAREAISQYRREVSDKYYSSENGIFNLSAKEGTRAYNTFRSEVDGIRDRYAESLNPNAKRKYLTNVMSHHNSHLDQLAKFSHSSGQKWKADVMAAEEGDDAESIAARLQEGNVQGVLAIINEPAKDMMGFELTEQQQRDRKDRLIGSAFDSYMTMNADNPNTQAVIAGAESLKEMIAPYASQGLENVIEADMVKFKDNIEKEAIAKRAKQLKAIDDQREQRYKDFTKLVEIGQMTHTTIDTDPHLSDLDKEVLKFKLNGGMSDNEKRFTDLAQGHAVRGTLTTSLKALYRRHIDYDTLDKLYNDSEKIRTLQENPGSNPDLKLALDELGDFKDLLDSDKKDSREIYWNIQRELLNAPEGTNYKNLLDGLISPVKESRVKNFFLGWASKEPTESAPFEVAPTVNYTEAEGQELLKWRDDYFRETGNNLFEDKSQLELLRGAQERVIRTDTDPTVYSDLLHFNQAEQIVLGGILVPAKMDDPVDQETAVKVINEGGANVSDVSRFASENDIDPARFTPNVREVLNEHDNPDTAIIEGPGDEFAKTVRKQFKIPENAPVMKMVREATTLKERRKILALLRKMGVRGEDKKAILSQLDDN